MWQRVHDTLREEVRIGAGHPPTPAKLRVDSQTVKTTHRGGPRGFDGGKKANGRKRFVEFVRRACRWKVTITRKAADGFKVQPRWWVVERTFGWLVRYRRLMVDYEFATETSEAMIQASMTHLMLRRLHPAR